MNSYLYNKKSKKDLERDLENEDFQRITLSFYKYIQLSNLETLRDALYLDLSNLNVLGRIYIASEGINAQISIPKHQNKKFIDYIYSYDNFNGIQIKKAVEEGTSFYKLIIKVKKEIVAYGISKNDYDINNTGVHLNAKQFNEMIDSSNSIVIDMRNIEPSA